jgi:hypothetical protein
MTYEQGQAIIAALGSLQSRLDGFALVFSGGSFFFQLMTVLLVVLLCSVMLYLFVKFFVRLVWGK